jgi:hypothetical protein
MAAQLLSRTIGKKIGEQLNPTICVKFAPTMIMPSSWR